MKREVIHKLISVEINCINKVIGINKRNIWDPGKLQTMDQDIGGRKCCNKTSGQQKHKVWDPGGLQQRNS